MQLFKKLLFFIIFISATLQASENANSLDEENFCIKLEEQILENNLNNQKIFFDNLTSWMKQQDSKSLKLFLLAVIPYITKADDNNNISIPNSNLENIMINIVLSLTVCLPIFTYLCIAYIYDCTCCCKNEE